MDWLNENAGLVVLIAAVITVILLVVTICMVFALKKKIAVQKPKFLGFYSTDFNTRERYAQCTIGNGSLNEIGIAQLGIKNGKVSFDLTDLYRQKKNFGADVRVMIEQRSSIGFTLTEEELKGLVVEGPKGRVLKMLRLYCVDLTGNLYKGKIKSVRKLLYELEHPGVPQTEHGGKLPPELKAVHEEKEAAKAAETKAEAPEEGKPEKKA